MTRGTPSTTYLIQAVVEWIEEVGPTLDHRNAYLARVSCGVLAIVTRELHKGGASAESGRRELSALLGREGGYEELSADLSERLRDGSLNSDTPGLMQVLRSITLNQLAIDQPKYKHQSAAQVVSDIPAPDRMVR